jgi:hypothetical protein
MLFLCRLGSAARTSHGGDGSTGEDHTRLRCRSHLWIRGHLQDPLRSPDPSGITSYRVCRRILSAFARSDKAVLTMEFLGYTHVKPVRRQWEIPVQTPGQYRYNSPGGGSANLEEITYYLRYLVALPTLRLTLDSRSAEFLTTPLLDQIRKEPLCRAAL